MPARGLTFAICCNLILPSHPSLDDKGIKDERRSAFSFEALNLFLPHFKSCRKGLLGSQSMSSLKYSQMRLYRHSLKRLVSDCVN